MAAGALQSATGFGFALIASPVLVGVYGGEAGITALTLVAVGLNTLTLATEGRRPAGDWGASARLVAWFLPGSVVGAVVLRVASHGVLGAVVAAAVLGAIAARLLTPAFVLPLAPAGLLAGVFGSSTGVSGPPLLMHLVHGEAVPTRVRDTLAAIFLATAVLSLGILAVVGAFALPGGAALAALLVAAGAGHVLGRRVFARLRPAGYERLVLATMGASAAATLVLLAT